MRRSFKKWTAQHLEQKWLSRSVSIGKPLPVHRPPVCPHGQKTRGTPVYSYMWLLQALKLKYFNMLAFKPLV